MNISSPARDRFNALGTQIRRARRAKDWTLDRLAGKLGVSKVSVWAWESGKTRPRTHLLEPLSKALDLPLESLLRGSSRAAESDLRAVIEDCQSRISEVAGVQPEQVEIKITFVGQDL